MKRRTQVQKQGPKLVIRIRTKKVLILGCIPLTIWNVILFFQMWFVTASEPIYQNAGTLLGMVLLTVVTLVVDLLTLDYFEIVCWKLVDD